MKGPGFGPDTTHPGGSRRRVASGKPSVWRSSAPRTPNLAEPSARDERWKPFGEGGRSPTAALVRIRGQGAHAQKGQVPGLGASIRLVASAGISEATTVTKSTLPSLRTTCTSPPESTKPDPAGTTWGEQVGSLAR